MKKIYIRYYKICTYGTFSCIIQKLFFCIWHNFIYCHVQRVSIRDDYSWISIHLMKTKAENKWQKVLWLDLTRIRIIFAFPIFIWNTVIIYMSYALTGFLDTKICWEKYIASFVIFYFVLHVLDTRNKSVNTLLRG